MKTVRIYTQTVYAAYLASETGDHFALTPWDKNTPTYQGEDDGGKSYILPEGYTLGRDMDGSPHITQSIKYLTMPLEHKKRICL
jgi:hypothetical protein